MADEKLGIKEWHAKQAKDCFNGTWNLIDIKQRTRQQEIDMIHQAHTSRFHWGETEGAKPINLVRGEWQISRVYALTGHGESALFHGQICLEACLEHGIEDFDLAFAYEAMARAYKILGDEEQKDSYIAKAMEASDVIKEQGDRDYAVAEIKSI